MMDLDFDDDYGCSCAHSSKTTSNALTDDRPVDCRRTDSGYYSVNNVSYVNNKNNNHNRPTTLSHSLSANSLSRLAAASSSPPTPYTPPTPAPSPPISISIPKSYSPYSSSFHLHHRPTPSSSAPSPSHLPKRPSPPTTPKTSISLARSTYNSVLLASHPLHPAFLAKYTLLRDLGQGATAFVVWGRRIADNLPVAVKFMYKDRVPPDAYARDRKLGTVPLEVVLLRRMKHEHVVGFVDFFEDERFFYLVLQSGRDVTALTSASPTTVTAVGGHGFPSTPTTAAAAAAMMTSPLSRSIPMTHTTTTTMQSVSSSLDLFTHIEQNPFISEHVLHTLFTQILSAMHYLHTVARVVHRDIKDENIILSSTNPLHILLIDFGTARPIPTNPRDYFHSFRGSVPYIPPELLDPDHLPYRGPEQDMWALGVLFYVLAFSQMPFKGAEEIRTGRWREGRWKRSEGVMEVLGGLLCTDVERRWDVERCREHEWVRSGPAPSSASGPSGPSTPVT
ncbi:kinase-like domain-containing protein [Gaertneriomyces semiglobifer]|nr:kinase-like domain-containing protein [Gaertneriomyces semiglobifer]